MNQSKINNTLKSDGIYLADCLNDVVSAATMQIIKTQYPNLKIHNISLNSKNIRRGHLFIACKGTKTDGRLYVIEACKLGAAAILIESEINDEEITLIPRYKNVFAIKIPNLSALVGIIASNFYNHPSEKINIIAFTGTNGKSSCTQYLATVLASIMGSCGSIGTLGSYIYRKDQPKIQINTGDLTTPNPIALQEIMANMVKNNVKMLAMEVSSHAIHQKRISGIKFKLSALTMLGRDHLDYHPSLLEYIACKFKLLDSEATESVVINYDDPACKKWLKKTNKQNIYAFSKRDLNKSLQHDKNNITKLITTKNKALGIRGINFTITDLEQSFHCTINNKNLSGMINIENILCIFTCLLSLNISHNLIQDALNNLEPVSGRMNFIENKFNANVFVDYAHTPDALEKALKHLKKYTNKKNKVICLFGCGGDRDKTKRPIMGAIASKYADLVILTQDNSRSERPVSIIRDILLGAKNINKITIVMSRVNAIKKAVYMLRPNDSLLLAGMGHDTYFRSGIRVSDAEVISDLLDSK